jgi:hypothetical protein
MRSYEAHGPERQLFRMETDPTLAVYGISSAVEQAMTGTSDRR